MDTTFNFQYYTWFSNGIANNEMICILLGPIQLASLQHFYWNTCTKPGKWAIIYLWVSRIDFAPFFDWGFGPVPTLWYFCFTFSDCCQREVQNKICFLLYFAYIVDYCLDVHCITFLGLHWMFSLVAFFNIKKKSDLSHKRIVKTDMSIKYDLCLWHSLTKHLTLAWPLQTMRFRGFGILKMYVCMSKYLLILYCTLYFTSVLLYTFFYISWYSIVLNDPTET